MKYFAVEYDIFHCNSDKFLIMLHGWGSNKEIFEEYINLLKSDYNIIVFDLYGFGQSVDPEPFFDIYEYAVQIYLFLKSRNIQRVEIIAHSFGGRIALILSSVFDITISKMVLTGCAGLKPRYSIKYYFKVGVYKLTKRLKKTNTRGSVDYKQANDNLKIVFVKVVNQHLNYLVRYVDAKVFFVWGKKDRDTPMYMYKKFIKILQYTRSCLLTNSAHFGMFEHSYLCRNKVREFLVLDDGFADNK